MYGVHASESGNNAVPFEKVKLLPFIKTFASESSFQGIPGLVRYPGFLKKTLWFTAIAICALGKFSNYRKNFSTNQLFSKVCIGKLIFSCNHFCPGLLRPMSKWKLVVGIIFQPSPFVITTR